MAGAGDVHAPIGPHALATTGAWTSLASTGHVGAGVTFQGAPACHLDPWILRGAPPLSTGLRVTGGRK